MTDLEIKRERLTLQLVQPPRLKKRKRRRKSSKKTRLRLSVAWPALALLPVLNLLVQWVALKAPLEVAAVLRLQSKYTLLQVATAASLSEALIWPRESIHSDQLSSRFKCTHLVSLA